MYHQNASRSILICLYSVSRSHHNAMSTPVASPSSVCKASATAPPQSKMPSAALDPAPNARAGANIRQKFRIEDSPPSFQDHPFFPLPQPTLSSLFTSFPFPFLPHSPFQPRTAARIRSRIRIRARTQSIARVHFFAFAFSFIDTGYPG